MWEVYHKNTLAIKAVIKWNKYLSYGELGKLDRLHAIFILLMYQIYIFSPCRVTHISMLLHTAHTFACSWMDSQSESDWEMRLEDVETKMKYKVRDKVKKHVENSRDTNGKSTSLYSYSVFIHSQLTHTLRKAEQKGEEARM